jgi:hypothetical protein
MVEWQMNADLQGILKEVDLVYSRYYYGTCLEGLRKTTKNVRRNSQCPS